MTLIRQFYHMGQRTLGRVDCAAALPPELRRLDSLARFLEYSQTCLALHMSDSQLLIASNKLKYDSDKNSPKAVLVFNAVKQLQAIAVNDLDGSAIYDRVFAPYGMPPLKSDSHPKVKRQHEAVNHWVASLEHDFQEEVIDALTVLRQPLACGMFSEASTVILSHMSSHSIQKAPPKFHPVLLQSLDYLQVLHTRALQDQYKILQILRSNDFQELREILLDEEAIQLVFPGTPADSKKDHHAEMNLMAQLIADDVLTDEEIYIAISKLSCFGCLIDLSYLSSKYNISVRGVHGVHYPTRMDSHWHEHTSEERGYHKPSGTDKTNEDFLFAENSDSDGEEYNVSALGAYDSE